MKDFLVVGVFFCFLAVSHAFMPTAAHRGVVVGTESVAKGVYTALKTYIETENLPVSGAAGAYEFLKTGYQRLQDTTHKELTERALIYAAKQLLQKYDQDDPTKYNDLFSISAVFREWRPFGTSADDFQQAINAVKVANANVDRDEANVTAAHFDGENIVGGNDRLLCFFRTAVSCIHADDYDGARVSVGRLLHGLQDFYSHTNYVELSADLHSIQPYPKLANKNDLIMDKDVASPNTATCKGCQRAVPVIGISLPAGTTCEKNLFYGSDNSGERPLTSGYYASQDRVKPTLKSPPYVGSGKCSHGGLLDTTSGQAATGGINKDSSSEFVSPHHFLHREAADVAFLASTKFLNDLQEAVDDDNFLRFLGLDFGPALNLVIDTTTAMKGAFDQIYTSVVSLVEGRSPPIDYVLVTFQDNGLDSAKQTRNSAEFINQLEAARASISGRKEKSKKVISSLIVALRKSRPGSTVYVFTTDDQPTDFTQYPEASALISVKRIKIYFVVSKSGVVKSGRRKRRSIVTEVNVYERLADESGGQVFKILPSNFGEALVNTESFLSPNDVTLLIRNFESGTGAHGDSFTVEVDLDMDNCTVIISGGLNPKINISNNSSAFQLSSTESVELETAAILNFRLDNRNEKVSDVNIHVTTLDAYDLQVKGSSSVDFQYELVTPSDKALHPGLFPVRGRPRIGDEVYIEVSVTWTDVRDGNVDEVRLLTMDGRTLDSYSVINATENYETFITSSNVTIPSDSFYIEIVGTYKTSSSGSLSAFRRVAPTLIRPVYFDLTLLSSDLSFRQGTTTTVQILVELSQTAPHSPHITYNVIDELGLSIKLSHSYDTLEPGKNKTVTFDVFVPTCYPKNTINTLTFTAKSETVRDETVTDSITIRAIVESEIIDNNFPVCILQSQSPCSLGAATWTAELLAIDATSEIANINVAGDDTANVNFAQSNMDDFAVIQVRVSCSLHKKGHFTLNVVDATGNKLQYKVEASQEPPKCPNITCSNGGKCEALNKCRCRPGYFGKDCNQEGCLLPSTAPSMALSIKDARESIGLNKSITFSCENSHALQGKNLRTCCRFGWTGSNPYCYSLSNARREQGSVIATFLIAFLSFLAWLV